MAGVVEEVSLDPEADAGHSLRRYVSAVWKRRWWILALVVLGAGSGWLKGRLSADVFSVRTEIDITKQRPFGLSPMGGSQVVSFGEGYLESQLHYPTRYKLLASGRYIATLLQEKVGAGGVVTFPMWDWLTWPAWSKEFPWTSEGAGESLRSRLEALCGPPMDGADALERLVGVPIEEFRRRFAFRAYGPAATRDPTSPFATPDDLRGALESHVEVDPVKGTALVDIELDGERPLVLAPLLNLLIETFSREQRTEGQRRLAVERDLVDRQMKALEDDVPGADGNPPARSLKVAERRLDAWIVAHEGNDANRIDLRRRVRSAQVEDAEREIRVLSETVTKMRGELTSLAGDEFVDRDDAAADRQNAATLRRRIVDITKITATSPDGPFHAMPFVLGDRGVAELYARIAALKERGTTADRTGLNVAVRQVALDKALTLAQSLDMRAARRDQYATDREDLNRSWALGQELAELQAEVDRRTKDLRELANRRDTIRTQEGVESGLQPLKVVEPAVDPVKPVRPNRSILLLMGAGVGLLIGLASAVFFDWLDDSVSDPADVERFLKAPVLGTIVALKPGQEGASEIDRIATRLPRSPVSEAFRAIRTSVEFLGTERDVESGGGRILLVSSCSPREGKTTVASNLASVLAQDGKRTLLVDADMRRPRVHQVFGIANGVGLSNVIVGQAKLEDAVVATDQENLWVLPSGATPPNPAELLGRKATEALLLRVGREFDRVVIDTPPVGVVTDAAVLGRRVGQVLLVVAAGRTKRRAAEHGESLLRSAGARPAGVVMNQVARSSRFLYGGYYDKDAAAYYGASDAPRP